MPPGLTLVYAGGGVEACMRAKSCSKTLTCRFELVDVRALGFGFCGRPKADCWGLTTGSEP